MSRKKPPWWKLTPRDLFLGAIALGILYDQVYVAREAQAILIGLVVFLFGSIPALRGDKEAKEGYGPFARFVLLLLGIKLPSEDPRDRSNADTPHGDTPSDSDSHDSSGSR